VAVTRALPLAGTPTPRAAVAGAASLRTTRPAEVDADVWRRARDLLCVRLDGMGDVLMTGPAIRALAECGPPGRRLAVLTSPAGADVARMLPGVTETLVYRAPWTPSGAKEDHAADLTMVDRLARRGFDAAAIFTVNTQSALPAAMLCRLAGVRRRLAHVRENPYGVVTDWVPEPEPGAATRHEVRRQLDLVAHVGARTDRTNLSVRLTRTALERARSALAAGGVAVGGRWLVVHPGASAPSRRYTPELFARAADLLVREGRQIVLTGDESDAGVVADVRAAMVEPAVSLVGLLTVEELAAVLSWSPVLVTNNTGPAHLAAALGTPVVDLYAQTNPQHAPWAVPHRLLFEDVPCRNCYRSECPEGHHRCLRGVPPEAIVDAVHELAGREATRAIAAGA
jgi:ADP-heptose:LPS heptosyltransferase